MPDGPPNNPAGRLLQITDRMKQKDMHDKGSREAWAAILGVQPHDLPALMRRIGEVATLVKDTSDAADRLQDMDPRWLKGWVDKFFQPWMNFNFGVNFGHFADAIDEGVLSLLNISDSLLSKQRPEPIVADEDLRRLDAEVVKLIQQVNAADLEATFKEYLLRHLQIIAAAIADYRVKGFEAFRVGLERIVGTMLLSDQRTRETLEKEPLGKQVMGVVGIYVLIVTGLLATLQIPHEIMKYLPPPEEKPPASVRS